MQVRGREILRTGITDLYNGRGGRVMSHDYRYAVDPAFDDNSEWIKCACGREYDRKEYNSDACIECENELTIKEREGK